MATLTPAAPRKAGSKPRARQHGFHLDMTPMVDLAFLLLTFFMLTTTFARPRVQELQMPVRHHDEQSPVPASRSMTVLLGRGREVAYYFGLNDPAAAAPTLHRTNFGPQGLRAALLSRQRRGQVVVLIKADKAAHYQSLVDALDEMNITDQKKYALTDLTAADQLLLATAP